MPNLSKKSNSSTGTKIYIGVEMQKLFTCTVPTSDKLLQLVRIQKFKDTSAGWMPFAVIEVCAHDLLFEGHSHYSQHRPAAKIRNWIRRFAS